jgi:SEC-C motif
MSDDALTFIAQSIRELRTMSLTSGTFRRIVRQDGDIVISIVASAGLPLADLEIRTEFRAFIEKYRRKARKSIGIGIISEDRSKPFHCASWIEGTWEYDEEIEKLVKDEPPFVPAPGQKLPGRNDPCLCGSGKKFKHCCLPKIERTIRNNLVG